MIALTLRSFVEEKETHYFRWREGLEMAHSLRSPHEVSCLGCSPFSITQTPEAQPLPPGTTLMVWASSVTLMVTSRNPDSLRQLPSPHLLLPFFRTLTETNSWKNDRFQDIFNSFIPLPRMPSCSEWLVKILLLRAEVFRISIATKQNKHMI